MGIGHPLPPRVSLPSFSLSFVLFWGLVYSGSIFRTILDGELADDGTGDLNEVFSLSSVGK